MKKLGRIVGLGIVLSTFASGCFKTPGWVDGTIECSADEGHPCPAGGACVANLCYRTEDFATFGDGGATD